MYARLLVARYLIPFTLTVKALLSVASPTKLCKIDFESLSKVWWKSKSFAAERDRTKHDNMYSNRISQHYKNIKNLIDLRENRKFAISAVSHCIQTYRI